MDREISKNSTDLSSEGRHKSANTNTSLKNADAQSIFTSASTRGDIITTMYLCNTTGSFSTANVFIVKNGEAANVALNIIYSNVMIQAGDTLVVDMEKIVLGYGDTIRANCTVNNSLVATVSSLAV